MQASQEQQGASVRRVAIIGAGRIGGGIARQLAGAGHDVSVGFARDRVRLEALAADIGATAGPVAEIVAGAEVVVLSVPWDAIAAALAQAGSLAGKIVIDTTNVFGSGQRPGDGETAATFNASRMPGARYTKSFNTLTAGFQAEAAGRPEATRVVQWVCGDDPEAKDTVAALIADAGFVAVDLGATRDCEAMEGPRREGAVYGEEYQLEEAKAAAAALSAGRPLPRRTLDASTAPRVGEAG